MSKSKPSLREEVADLRQRVEKLEEMANEGVIQRDLTDLQTFVKNTNPDTHTERALSLGYYLVHVEGTDPFEKRDIEDMYNRARFKPPANMSDVLAGAEENEWIFRVENGANRVKWSITSKGNDTVEEWIE